MTRGTDLVTGTLPDYARESLAELTDPAGVALDPVLDVLDRIDPDTSSSGTCELANPAAARSQWLPWLAWSVGVDLAGLPAASHRSAITDATLRLRGSQAAIEAAVRTTLTGPRHVRVQRAAGGDPYAIVVHTYAAQTPDEEATLAAALREKPAGIVLTLSVDEGMSYADLAEEYETYEDLTASGLTYDELAHLLPPEDD